jgi:hypothetical protein
MSDEATPQQPAPCPVVIRLRTPITEVDGVPLDVPLTKLTLRPLKAKDLRSYDERKPAMGQQIDFAGKLSGQPREVIDELSGPDLGEVMGVVDDFFLGIRRPGQPSSDG